MYEETVIDMFICKLSHDILNQLMESAVSIVLKTLGLALAVG